MLSKIRYKLLPPGSMQELIFRSVLYRIKSNRLIVDLQIKKARASYLKWRRLQRFENASKPVVIETLPKVVFLMAIETGEEQLARLTIRSITEIVLLNWELIPIISKGSMISDLCDEYSLDSRIKNAINIEDFDLRETIIGQSGFTLFCAAGDIFDSLILNHLTKTIVETSLKEIIYYDVESRSKDELAGSPFFKPPVLSPELMISTNYLSRSFIANTSIIAMNIENRSFDDLLAYEYYLLLQMVKRKSKAIHIPRILAVIQEANEARDNSLNDTLRRYYKELGCSEVTVKKSGDKKRINWKIPDPLVSLIILNHNHGRWLRALIDSITKKTDYTNYQTIVVDNRSTEASVLNYYEILRNRPRTEIVNYDHDFNYSEAINIGVSHAVGEVMVLLNNDMRIIDPAWLRELIQWSLYPEIGVVGAKLMHRNLSIQHAGIIIGMNKYIGHLYLNAPEDYHGLVGSVNWYRNYHALTGACQAVRREIFDKVGGYDDRYTLAFGDINFCLKVEKAGYRNMYNPFSRLIHYEGGSRGIETPLNDILLGYDEILDLLRNGDHYFARNLSYTSIPYCIINTIEENERLAHINELKSILEDGLK